MTIFVQICKRKQHTKNHIDWIKNEGTGEVQSLLYSVQPDTRILFIGIPDAVDILEFFFHFFKKYLQINLVIYKEKKF